MNRMDGRDTCIYTSETSNLLDIIVIIPGQQKKGVKTAVIIEYPYISRFKWKQEAFRDSGTISTLRCIRGPDTRRNCIVAVDVDYCNLVWSSPTRGGGLRRACLSV